MTFQIICLVINLALVLNQVRIAKKNDRAKAFIECKQKEIRAEYENLQSIHTEISRRGKAIHLKIRLEEIDIDRVKDPETQNYLAIRRLITTFNPN